MNTLGGTDLKELLRNLNPRHTAGDYVFCVVGDETKIKFGDVVMFFTETEGNTIIIKKEAADSLQLPYSSVFSWITLTVHSSLAAVGLTAAFAQALAEHGISCNSVAAYYHDHIFVDKKDTEKALDILKGLSK